MSIFLWLKNKQIFFFDYFLFPKDEENIYWKGVKDIKRKGGDRVSSSETKITNGNGFRFSLYARGIIRILSLFKIAWRGGGGGERKSKFFRTYIGHIFCRDTENVRCDPNDGKDGGKADTDPFTGLDAVHAE